MSKEGRLRRGKLYARRLELGLSIPKQLKTNNADLGLFKKEKALEQKPKGKK